MTRRAALAAAALLPAGWLAAAPRVHSQAERPTAMRPVVARLSPPGLARPNEVAVAINPADRRNVVVVSGARPAHGASNVTFVTIDGGRTWRTIPAPRRDERFQGDDALTFDAGGVAWRSYIAFRGLLQPAPAEASTGIFVSRSTDGGLTWQSPLVVVDHDNTISPFEDKPWLAADTSPDSPHAGTIYVAWTRFDVYGSESPSDHSHIFIARSAPDRSRFLPPVRVSDRPGDALDGDGTVEGAVPAVGPRGEVYLAWAGPRGIEFDRSMDGGLTFGADVRVADMSGGWDIDVAGLSRHNGLPVTAVDLSARATRGVVYIAWIDGRHGDPDVFLASSRDGGGTWSAPRRVPAGAPGDGRQQLFTWLAVDPADGAVNLVYLERDRDDAGSPMSVVLARSEDGGERFEHIPVPHAPFTCPKETFIGDYTGIAARDGLVAAAWTHCLADGELAVSAALLDVRAARAHVR